MAGFNWRSPEHRREVYMVIGIVIAALGLSHALGYWPYTATAKASPMNQELLWRIIFTASLLGVGILYYLGRRHGSTGPTQTGTQVPLIGPDYAMFMNARSTYELLPFPQKILLKRIYEQPGLPLSSLAEGMVGQGFADGSAVVAALLNNTNLVDKSFEGRLYPSPHQPIVRSIVKALKESPP